MRKSFRWLWTIVVPLSLICLTTVSAIHQVTHAASSTETIWLQTMDSCKLALDGTSYVLSGGVTTISASRSGNKVKNAGTGSGCPAQGGNCSTIQTGCLSFAVPVPASGMQTYTVEQTLTPPPNSSNPQGYAPCQGGSACQSEEVDLTIDATGLVKATVTNVYPDGSTKVWPNPDPYTKATYYTGTTTDPIVTHNFGLGTGNCDGDKDADDHLTGSPGSHCGYPEKSEATACQPFPWACNWVYEPATGQYQRQ
jgi:hypothetical protein